MRTTVPNHHLLSLPPSLVTRKLRSDLPRRKRTRISPIVQLRRSKSSASSELSVNSSSCSFFEGEVSCGSESKPSLKKKKKKRKHGESEERYGGLACEVEVSESSCVESNYSGAGNGAFGESSRVKPKSKRGKRAGVSKVIIEEEKEDSNVVHANAASGIKEQTEVVSCISGAESRLGVKSPEKTVENTGKSADEEEDQCEISENFFGKSLAAVSNSESTINQRPEIGFDLEADSLACTEHFSYDSQETAYTDEILLQSSEIDFSDYTPSIFVDSGSEFSERSVDDSAPSPTYALLLQYRGDFCRSMSPRDDGRVASRIEEESIDQSRYARFEDEEDEESYAMLRKRERRAMVSRDYVDEYSRTTQYGPLIFQQRLNMVHWIIQHCKDKNLQQETLFLGVNLLDRFLSKGFFKTKRVLQIAGIACISLATRIEENQPFNSVRVRSFSVGKNVYSRCEVVAMEWLVQEVLGFKCFLPTIFNFLWFYLKAAKAEEEVEKRAKYLAVLLLPDQDPMHYLPSTVAAAIVILASLEEDQDSSIQNVIETHIRTKREDLHECIESLEWLLGYV